MFGKRRLFLPFVHEFFHFIKQSVAQKVNIELFRSCLKFILFKLLIDFAELNFGNQLYLAEKVFRDSKCGVQSLVIKEKLQLK